MTDDRKLADVGGDELSRVARAFQRDGVSALEAHVARVAATPARLERLVAASTTDLGVPATWLLRAYLQRGAELSSSDVATLLRSLRKVRHDDARLHICQTVVDLMIPKRNAEQLARWLRELTAGSHKFCRAWAVDAFFRLACQHESYREEALQLVDAATRDAAASVRARARNVLKEFRRT